MRQVNQAELIYNLGYALTRLPASVLNDLASRERRRRQQGIDLAAVRIADVLERYEILSDAPLEHGAGDDLFVPAVERGGSGVAAVDGNA